MTLRKLSENYSRQFDTDGNATDILQSAQLAIYDADGNHIGNADINQGQANINISFSGYPNVQEGVAKLHQIFGLSE